MLANKILRPLWLLVLSLFCVLSAHAATPDNTIITTMSTAQLKRFMQDEGFTVSDSAAGNVKWDVDGITAVVKSINSGKAIQMQAAFDSKGKGSLQKVNQWNASKNFSRSYIDKEGDPVLELDLDLSGGVTAARLRDFFVTCQVSVPTWANEAVR